MFDVKQFDAFLCEESRPCTWHGALSRMLKGGMDELIWELPVAAASVADEALRVKLVYANIHDAAPVEPWGTGAAMHFERLKECWAARVDVYDQTRGFFHALGVAANQADKAEFERARRIVDIGERQSAVQEPMCACPL